MVGYIIKCVTPAKLVLEKSGSRSPALKSFNAGFPPACAKRPVAQALERPAFAAKAAPAEWAQRPLRTSPLTHLPETVDYRFPSRFNGIKKDSPPSAYLSLSPHSQRSYVSIHGR